MNVGNGYKYTSQVSVLKATITFHSPNNLFCSVMPKMSGTVALSTQCWWLSPMSFSMAANLYPSSTASSGLPMWLGWLSQHLLASHHYPGLLPNSQPPPSRKGGDLRSGTGTGEEPVGPCQHSFKEWSLGMKVSSFNLLIAPVKHQMSWKVKGNDLNKVCRLSMHVTDP